MSIKEMISAARGEKKADLLLKNGQLVNVISGEIYPANVAIFKGKIIGIGDYEARQEIDLKGKYICPGFIDAHVHIESSMLSPQEFAAATVSQGTTAVVADPHEIANVIGKQGLQYMLEASSGVPQDIFFMLPSCVPATDKETSGAILNASSLKPFLKHKRVIGLGEVMDCGGVLSGDNKTMAKIEAVLKAGKLIDGHAPGLSGRDLEAYITAGIGSDHECVRLEETKEKLRLGMHILIREGSSAKNLEALLPLVSPSNSRFFSFCTDDLHPRDISQGHINLLLKKAVSLGMDPITAVQIATVNSARHFGLKGIGAVAPGYSADIAVVDDLHDFKVDKVFKAGGLVAEKGKAVFKPKQTRKAFVKETMRAALPKFDDFVIRSSGKKARVIELISGQIATSMTVEEPLVSGDQVKADVEKDTLKLVVIERHKASGRVGKGLVKGFGLRRGAIAQSISHDSHNIICVGAGEEDMLSAVRRIIKLKGGIVVVAGGLVLAELSLPIAGLMSSDPMEEVVERFSLLEDAARDIGCVIPDPFEALSFLALPVIPNIRLTDRGLIDTQTMRKIELFE